MVALSAGGLLVAEVDAASATPVHDRSILRMLAAGERLAIAVYERAGALPDLPSPVGIWIEGAVSNEREHLRVLSELAPDLTRGAVRLAPGAAANLAAALVLAEQVETALLAAYLGAVTELSSPQLQSAAAAIAANEAQHLAAVRRIGAGRLVTCPAIARGAPTARARTALAAAGAPLSGP